MEGRSITALSEYEGAALLREWGIPVVDQILAGSEQEVLAAAKKLGYPVVLKVCSKDVLHKTEQGGVILNIRNTGSLSRAVRELKKRFSKTPHSLLVQKMAGSGVELILGARRDPIFGPIVLAGIGGIFTEIFRDTVIELAPLNAAKAGSMLRRLKGFALLNGFRSQPPVDLDTVTAALTALSKLITKRKDILEIDINPMIAYPDGAFAVDALVRRSENGLRSSAGSSQPDTIDPFFNPRSFALIGASKTPGKGGNIILRNLLKAGYKGKIYPINPTAREILGMPAYAKVSDVPGPVDLAMIVIPKSAVADAISDCAAKGTTNIILSTGGYSDMGTKGRSSRRRL